MKQVVILTLIILSFPFLQSNVIYASTDNLFTVNVNTYNLVGTRFSPSEIKNFVADETGIYIPTVKSIIKFDHQMNKLWEYNEKYPTIYTGFSSPLNIVGNEIYVVGTPSDIYKIDKTTGKLIDHLTIPYFTPSPWYTNPPIVLDEKIITWGNGQICVLTKTPLTKINCKTVTPFKAVDFKYYVLASGALVGKTYNATVNSYDIEKIENPENVVFKNWQSKKVGGNEQSNTNIAAQTDIAGNIYYLSGGQYGPTQPNTYYLQKLDAGNGDTVEVKEIKAYGTNYLGSETIQIDKINNILYFTLNDKNTPENENNINYPSNAPPDKQYRRLYAIDLNKTTDYIKYSYPFETNTYINKNLIMHNQKIYINNNKQLYIFDQNGFYTKLNIGYNLLGTPQISKDNNGEYVFYSHTTKIPEEYNTNRFIGIKVENLKYCPTGLYCTDTPKHHPVIFIHGFGGNPASWEDGGDKQEYKKRLLALYRQDDPEFPEDWLVSYSYGYDINGKYDYQGRIEDISAGMNQLVPFLSQEHKFYGGDGKVDIVGYSLGGIVARNYLYNNSKNHHVRKLITIATPHKGVDWLNYEVSLRNCAFVQCFGPDNVFKRAVGEYLNRRREDGNEISLLSDPVTQLTPSSSQYYLNKLTKNISDIEGYALYGNIAVKTEYKLFGIKIEKELSIGDGIVTAKSAKDIPGINNGQ